MIARKKLWLGLTAAILALTVIACSCNALSFLTAPEALPGLAGKWQDPDTLTIHTISWLSGKYVVVSSIDNDNEVYVLKDQTWQDGTLTWTYYVPSTGYSVTFETVSLNGDSLATNWSNDHGDSGTQDLQRVH